MMQGELLCTLALYISMSSCVGVAGESQWEKTVDESGKTVQSLQIQAPAMTEEDQYGYIMPDRYQCDSCKAVMFHLNHALVRKQPKSRRLQEWEYEEVFQETCKHGFKGYGIKLVNGKNTLSGPALQHDNLQPGMGAIQMGGETWEKRLGEICRKIVYDKVGEDVLYESFQSDGTLSQELCFRKTSDCRSRPEVSVKPEIQVRKTKASKGQNKETSKKNKKDESESVAMNENDRGKASEQVLTGKEVVARDEVDVSMFLAELAVKHGVAPNEYINKRACKDWEQMFVKVAGRIFANSSNSEDSVFL